MKIPDMSLEEANKIADGAYYIAEDSTSSPDYLIANTAYRHGIDAARDDLLEALELFAAYPGMEYVSPWREAIVEMRDYIFSHLTLKDWYNT